MINIEEIQFAFRDEKVNIFAMTYGGLPDKYTHQIILCKKSMLPGDRKGPFLLDPKRSDPVHKLSQKGIQYSNKIKNNKYDLRYIAYVDAEIKVKISLDLFKKLAESGFFSVWDQEAPYKYFDGALEGYLVIFRVYEIHVSINERLLEIGRKGRHFYYRLNNRTYADIIAPVTPNDDYFSMKQELYMLLQDNAWMLEVNEYSTPSVSISKVDFEHLVKEEETAIVENATLSLKDLIKKIAFKKIKKKLIIVESIQYYRDPDISSFAQKRAGGVCECCGKSAPFNRDDSRPYLETHHLVLLSKGGSDSVENVCAVCPNCHRELHFGANKSVLKDKIMSSNKRQKGDMIVVRF